MKDIIKVAAVNFFPETKDINLSKMESFIKRASEKNIDLLLFPEMCLTGYDMYIDETISRTEKILMAETLSGPSVKRIESLSIKYGMFIIFGMPEQDGFLLFNSAVVTGPEGIIGSYRKIHPFGPELTWCEKGDTPFMFDTPWGRIGIGICYDTYQFPEIMRYCTYKGCRLYLNPTALPEETDKEGSRAAFLDYYRPMLEYGTLCNTIFIASSNLTGRDRFSTFGGGSVIIGPRPSEFYETQVMTYGGDFDCIYEGIYDAELDLSAASRRLCIPRRQSGTPDFRPDIYRRMYEEE